MDNLKIKFKASCDDNRDFVYTPSDQPLEKTGDLRQWAMLIENQGILGSCTGNAIVSGYELQTKRLYPDQYEELSRLFVYYNVRTYENITDYDSGVSIRDGLKSLCDYGVCMESLWPYNISKFTEKPSQEAYDEAVKRKIPRYQRLTSLEHTLDAINNYYPVVAGIEIFNYFFDLTAANSTVDIITENQGMTEGHAVLVVGYDLDKKIFIVENSFGKNWGDSGYFYMSFDYFTEYLLEQWIFDIPDLSLTVQKI